MALDTAQLNNVKTKMESGVELRKVVRDDYPNESVPSVRAQMIEEFGQSTFRDIMLDSRLHDKTVEELNAMLTNIQGRIAKITSIRDSRL